MFQTLFGPNGAFSNLGNIQIQPVKNDISYTVKIQSTNVQTQNTIGPLPASESALSTPFVVHIPNNLKVVINPSLSDIANSLTTDSKYDLPALRSMYNTVLPSYAYSVSTSSPSKSVNTNYDNVAVTTKKFEPYEQMTGMSRERPEIVLMTNFQPMFVNDANAQGHTFTSRMEDSGVYNLMTNAGHFIDTQIHVRNLMNVNSSSLYSNLMRNWAELNNTFTDRAQAFQQQLNLIRDLSNFLVTVVKNLDRLKQKLDLRDSIHEVIIGDVVKDFVLNFTRAKSVAAAKKVTYYSASYLPPKYDIVDALVRLGYTQNNVENYFLSTKIWLQLQLELRDVMRAHSLEFIDVKPTVQSGDTNASTITKSNVTLFGIREIPPIVPSANDIINTSVSQLTSRVKSVSQAFGLLYDSVHFNSDEARIAALTHLISREFRYSYGLSDKSVQTKLSTYYGYSVVENGNPALMDAIFGQFGNNVSDIPANVNNSLANISQDQPAANVALLTFESDYIKGDTGTLTPGSEFYVNYMLQQTDGKKFDTTRIDKLASRLDEAHDQLSYIINGLNFLSVYVTDSSDPLLKKYASTLIDPVEFFESITNQIIGSNGETFSYVSNDLLTSIYAQAQTNQTIKSLLFIYIMNRVSRTYKINVPYFNPNQDNTPLTDSIALDIIAVLTTVVPNVKSVALGEKVLQPDSIKAALKNGTILTSFVELVMSRVLLTFKYDTSAITTASNRTRYGGYQDTIILMAMFDLVISLVSKYSNQHITGYQLTGTAQYQQPVFYVSTTKLNFLVSYREIVTRLEREVAFAQQLLFATLNSLNSISGALHGVSNYLNSPTSLQKLQAVSSAISDQTLFHMMMNEQQILVLFSAISDLTSKLVNSNSNPLSKDGASIDQILRSVDDSNITPALHNALYSLFGSNEYAQCNAVNKKILTVGIPLGFTQTLKNTLNISTLKKSTYVDKRNDIVNVTVYKVDMENSDIVYKPQYYTFELTRFPVRDDSLFRQMSRQASMDEIISAIPTRDVTQDIDGQGTSVFYWTSGNNKPPVGFNVAFSDESYDFLSQTQKYQILCNTVLSYMLEVYLKLLSGIDTSDISFDLVEPPKMLETSFVKLVTEHHVSSVAKTLQVNAASSGLTSGPNATVIQPPPAVHPSGGVLFSNTTMRVVQPPPAARITGAGQQPKSLSNSAGTAGISHPSNQFASIQQPPPARAQIPASLQRVVGNLNTSLSTLTHRTIPLVLHDMRTISTSVNTLTPLASPDAITKKLLNPKQFDRVFNLLIDPDSFEVDVEATKKTPHGYQAFLAMLAKGDIVEDKPGTPAGSTTNFGTTYGVPARNFSPGRPEPFVNRYRFRTRDTNAGDVMFEKYFVTVETLDEQED